MRYLVIVFAIALTAVGAVATNGASVPPALGPPLNRAEDGALWVPAVAGLTTLNVQRFIDKTNQDFVDAGSSTRVAIESFHTSKAFRVQTQSTSEPNSWYVRIPHKVVAKAKIRGLGDRRFHIPIDLHVSCENWQLPTGRIVIRAIPGKVTVTGGTLLEDFFLVRERINAAIEDGLASPNPVTVSTDPMPCSSLGVTGEDIFWDLPPRSRPGDSVIGPTIEVTFERLKRLPARGRAGTVIYQETEEIVLNLFANYDSPAQRHLTMRDGDDVALELAPVRLKAGTYEKLVIIGNIMQQQPTVTADSAFKASAREQNYAPGRYVLKIPKVYFVPGHPKPSEVHVPAYELSYTVRYLDPSVRQLHPR